MKMTTDRDFEKELCFSRYNDMENGDDTETICYPSLIHIITELYDKIAKLESRLDKQDDYQQEQQEQNEI
jgi:hypothetical protein